MHKNGYRILTALLILPVLALTVLSSPPQPGYSAPAFQATETVHNYVNDEYGVRVNLPSGWKAEAGEGPDSIAWFFSPARRVATVLFLNSFGGASLEELASSLKASLENLLDEPSTVRNGAITLNNGNRGWETVLSGKRKSDGSALTINLTTAIHANRSFSLMSFAAPGDFTRFEKEIRALNASLHIDPPSLYGIRNDQALVLAGGESTNPREHDPATTHSSGDKLVFSGLLSFDPQINLVPELAERWEVSRDGLVYTFHMRRNARFHDGRPVTAADVIYSWERAADPELQSDTVLTYLGDIVGVKEMNEGKTEHISGLKALDDHTLQVTIDAPKPYFPLKLTYPTAFVVDRANVESGPEWYRTPNGTGPYKLIQWQRFEALVYAANPDFYLGKPAIPYVIVRLYSGVGIRLYEAGEIDITSVYSSSLPRFLDPAEPMQAEMVSGVNLCTSYVIFDASQPPFDDVKVRQAFSMAFDRKKYIDVVLHGVGIPAEGIYPPALPGYSLELKGLQYDPDQARKLLAESKYGRPAGMPEIVFTGSGLGSDVSPGTAAMVEMWEQNLGVSITIENIEPNIYFEQIFSGKHGQLLSIGWCADYPDPENFADVLFHSDSKQNIGSYSSPALDALLERARVEQDVSKRIDLYQQAERLIVQDAPAVFIVHSLSHVLVKPYLKGYVLTPIDIPLERYLYLEGK